MILVLDLCERENSLSTYEFVEPVAGIVRRKGFPVQVRHHLRLTGDDLTSAERIILCGTALRDNAFAERPAAFAWLRGARVPVLGICAGMQAVALAFGGSLVPSREIGMTEIRSVRSDSLLEGYDRFPVYELHDAGVLPPAPFLVLAESDRCIQAIRHRDLPIYGILFHPEVRNEWVVERFLALPWRIC
ncbi:MAG: gamma-glutamyl-gamma-aminobutyrate hydrolase family protein [Methanomicrobiales archaeon]|nr:gamma-glutamyl-gamma-aminobutyrate hydrolase family protein [Methanomicrobiales archaeon]